MNVLPHIDIIEPERIASLFADERNFSWRAVDSERLDSWSPDLGLTGYQNPSIYRAGEVATSGISSSLRQRFWQTVQGQADHTGARYIGILIYCQAGETCPMDLQLASNIIGRVEPGRHDNRLHLIVVDQPVEFMGEMEIFRLTAPGKGTYRIEAFVLLHERPEPSSFAPEIQHLASRVIDDGDAISGATLHFTTSRVASVSVSLAEVDGAFHAVQSGDSARRHRLVFAGLPREKSFKVDIIAKDAFGNDAVEAASLSTHSQAAKDTDEVVVPLELVNRQEADLTGLPLAFGIPFARGAAPHITSCRLACAGEDLSARSKALSCWDDGSVRWALFETSAPPAIAAKASVFAAAHINGSVSSDEIAGDPQPGELSGALAPADLSFEAILADGTTLCASGLRHLERDDNSLRFTIDHSDKYGVAHLRSAMRLQFYPDQTFVKLHHRLEVISPALASAQGGDLPADCSADMRENIVGDSGEESTLLKLRSFSLRIPFAGVKAVRYGGEEWRVGGKTWGLRHDHDLAYTINGDEYEGRAKGHIRVEGEAGSLGIGVRNFWQTYPKALSVGGGGIDLQLFPDRRGIKLPGDEDAWHRLYFWLDEDGYKLKAGMALSSEILLDFGAGDPAVFDWLENPPLVRPDIDYLNSSGALNPIGARRDSVLPNYEELADLAIRSFYDDQEHYRAFGQVNFGDWYGESGWSWGNNEYDPAYVGYTEFLRGGDPAWGRWAADSARHLADVDTINFSGDASQIGGQAMHIAGHLGGYLPPFFRSKMRGTSAGPAHMWVEGPLLHYLMTGDEFVYDSICKTKEWLIQNQRLDHYEYKSARDSGWHLIHLTMLAAALDDPDCLNAARIIVERVLERQAPGGGWERVLGEPHCGCGFPRCQGEAGFMVCILISGLMRFHRLTNDAAVADAIIGGARWLIRETFDDASGYFRYTSCPNRSLGGNYSCTQWVMEGLAAAWELSGDREIGRHLKRGLGAIGMYPARLSHMGLGKAMSQQMRYVPTILAALNQRPLEGIDD